MSAVSDALLGQLLMSEQLVALAGAVLEFTRLALCRNGASSCSESRRSPWQHLGGENSQASLLGPKVLTFSAGFQGTQS